MRTYTDDEIVLLIDAYCKTCAIGRRCRGRGSMDKALRFNVDHDSISVSCEHHVSNTPERVVIYDSKGSKVSETAIKDGLTVSLEGYYL
jgi:hypothetical protein